MDPIAAPPPTPDAQARLRNEQPRADNAVAANNNAEQRLPEPANTPQAGIAPAHLSVALDEGAQRYVQVFTDPDTDELVRRYPSEAQLAYSRAVVAYMRALNDSWRDGDS